MSDPEVRNGRRLAPFKEGCSYGKFGRTKAYELIDAKIVRSFKMGARTLLDLDSIDRYHASLPELKPHSDAFAGQTRYFATDK